MFAAILDALYRWFTRTIEAVGMIYSIGKKFFLLWWAIIFGILVKLEELHVRIGGYVLQAVTSTNEMLTTANEFTGRTITYEILTIINTFIPLEEWVGLFGLYMGVFCTAFFVKFILWLIHFILELIPGT